MEHCVDIPVLSRNLRHDLLGQYVQRPVADDQPVELALADRAQQRGALDQLIPSQGEESSLGGAVNGVAGAAHPLEESGNPPGGADLATRST